MGTGKLHKFPSQAMLFGVCAGIGRCLGIQALWVRLAFFFAFWFFGTGVLVYIALAIFMPEDDNDPEEEDEGDLLNI